MMRFWTLLVTAVTGALALAFFSPGCADPCGNLAEVCARCGDIGYRESCELSVARGSGSVCAGQLSTFSAFCTASGEGGAGGSGTDPSAGCIPSELKCLSQCVNPKANSSFCGSCNTQCKEGELCGAGQCFKADTCPVTLPDKNEHGGCTDQNSDPTCCGAACSRCGATLACVKGFCAPADTCVGQVCSGACTSTFTDPLNCGKCGGGCTPGEVCSAGLCAATCGGSLTQCCGKCVDVSSNGPNCGGCAPGCPEAASAGTGGASQQASLCPQGHQACGAAEPLCSSCACASTTKCVELDKKTVCGESCVDITSEPGFCGSCTNACGPGENCSAGACLSGNCPTGRTACSGGCVALQSDAANCGSCGHLCQSGSVCDGGTCAESCTLPRQPCGLSCVDVSKDANNCGKCGAVCAAGEVCTPTQDGAGSCVNTCPSGLTNCGGACVDLTQDFDHCGACGNICNDDSVCTADSCALGKNGATCKNESGASLCGPAMDDCTERKCDPKLGCVSTLLGPGAIAAGCLNNPDVKKPPGWSSDDVKNMQLQCLWCDKTKQGAAACAFGDRVDAFDCTVDTCAKDRQAAPSHLADDTVCAAQLKGSICCPKLAGPSSGCGTTLSCGP